MESKEKLNEDVKYLIRRTKEVGNLLRDGKHVQAYHKSLGVNQKLADLQEKIENGEIELCDKSCPKESSDGRMIKYGNVEEVEKTG